MTADQRAKLEELKASDELVIFAEDVVAVIGGSAQTLRNTAQRDVRQVGFPATVVGDKLKIFRKPFLRYIGEM